MNLPYKIEFNDVLGRYLVATKDIKQGETILKEAPLVIGAPIKAFPICFNCCAQINFKSVNVCKNCNLALLCASNKCVQAQERHTNDECLALKKSGLKPEDIVNNPQIILPLRCMLMRQYDLDKFGLLLEMEAHLDARKDSYIWRLHKTNIEDVLKELGVLSKADLEAQLIQRICGILDVNTFEIRPPTNDCINLLIDPNECLRGVYVETALMAHDCVANTLLSVDDQFLMIVNASVDISKGNLLYVNYSNALQGSNDRRRHLREGKYFACKCKRCSDNTELGTHLSSMQCTKCKIGLVLCTDPLQDNPYQVDWVCAKCGAIYKGILLETAVNVSRDKISDLSNLAEAENLLNKMKLTFAPQHYLILEIKQTIITLLNEGWMTDEMLSRKIKLCREMIEFFKIIEPGISRLQGIAQYELHISIINLSNREYNNKIISTKDYLNKLQSAEDALKMSIKFLLYEPKNSPEGRLAQKALTDLRILRGTVSDIQRITAMEGMDHKNVKKITNSSRRQ